MTVKQEKVGKQYRYTEFKYESTRNAANGDPIIRVAASSEYPVTRSDGVEILDHSTSSVDMSRLQDGAAFLVDHTTSEVAGVVENASVDADRVIRADIRFSRSVRGQEIMNDMKDGIRRHISIGYFPQKKERSRNGEGDNSYRVTRWLPFEISTVAIPADPTVGVGRANEELQDCEVIQPDEAVTEVERSTQTSSSNQDDSTMSDKKTDTTTNATVGEDLAQTRASEIVKLAVKEGFPDKASEWILSDRSVDSIAREILNSKPTKTVNATDPAGRMNEKDLKDYSMVRAIVNFSNKNRSGLEFEISDELAKNMGKSTEGFFVPTALRSNANALTSTDAGHASENVFTSPAGFIDYLRIKTQVLNAGAQFLTGLGNPIKFVRQTATGGASWVGENGTAVSDANLTVDSFTLAPKTAASTQIYSRQLLIVGNYSVESMVRADIADNFAVALDRVALAGSGSSSGEPTGVLNTAGITSASMGVSGSAITWAKVVGMESAIYSANAEAAGMSYMFSPGVVGNLKQIPKNPNSGSLSQFIMDDNGQVNGYSSIRSNNLPQDLINATVTGLHVGVFGDWSKLIVAEFGAMELIPDPYTLATTGLIRLTGLLYADVGVKTPKSFNKLTDIKVT